MLSVLQECLLEDQDLSKRHTCCTRAFECVSGCDWAAFQTVGPHLHPSLQRHCDWRITITCMLTVLPKTTSCTCKSPNAVVAIIQNEADAGCLSTVPYASPPPLNLDAQELVMRFIFPKFHQKKLQSTLTVSQGSLLICFPKAAYL